MEPTIRSVGLRGRQVLQYGWDKARPAVFRVPSGATLDLELQDASDGQITPTSTSEAIPRMDRARGNPIIGPIALDSAAIGEVLQVDVLEVAPAAWGWTGIDGVGDVGLADADRTHEEHRLPPLDEATGRLVAEAAAAMDRALGS